MLFKNSTERARDLRELCKYDYDRQAKGKNVQPHGLHLIVTLEQANKQKVPFKKKSTLFMKIQYSQLKTDCGFDDTSDLCIFMITTKLNHFLEMGTLLPQSAA